MKTIHLVVAFGGTYEDAWETDIRAFSTEAKALALANNYEKWIDELRQVELPESCQGHDIDWDNEDEVNNLQISIDEFWKVVMDDMGIPEEDRDFMDQNRETSYGCDRPSYKVVPLELAD